MRRPRIEPILLFIATAVLFWLIEGTTGSRDLQTALQVMQLAFVGAAGFCIVDLTSWAVIDRRRLWVEGATESRLAHARTLERVARLIMEMTPEQREAFGRQRAEIEVVASNVAPLYTLVLPFARVDWPFLEGFIAAGTAEYMTPIRRYGEGTQHRAWAEAITDYMVGEGYAKLAEGNQPAKWVSQRARAQGLRSIGFEEGAG
jgi:hypothetical protein